MCKSKDSAYSVNIENFKLYEIDACILKYIDIYNICGNKQTIVYI